MSTTAEIDMAKKQAKAKPEEKPRKPMVVQIRGSEEWKAFVEMVAEKEGDTLTKFFERAVRKFAKDAGYGDPPKR